MVSRSRESVKDKPTEPELEGNIRKPTSASVAVWQAESQDAQVSAGGLGAMLGEVSKVSMEEIDQLISELETLRRKLQNDGDRIERDIRQSDLNQRSHPNFSWKGQHHSERDLAPQHAKSKTAA